MTGDSDGPVVMWEVRVAEGQVDELMTYLIERVDGGARVYRSADEPPRVVVIYPTGADVVEVPDELVARPPQSWPFVRVSGPA